MSTYRSEELVISEIRRRFGGRRASSPRSRADTRAPARRRAGRTWVIDPLDGTVNYANGIPFYCVSIGLVAAMASRWSGWSSIRRAGDLLRRDGGRTGAPRTARRSSASTKEQLGDYVVSLAIIGRGGIWRERRIARQIRISRRMGSAALALAYVASGRFDAMVQNGGLSLWDVTAAGLIAERAGATVSDLFGGPWWKIGTPSRRRSRIVAAPAAASPGAARAPRAGPERRSRRAGPSLAGPDATLALVRGVGQDGREHRQRPRGRAPDPLDRRSGTPQPAAGNRGPR